MTNLVTAQAKNDEYSHSEVVAKFIFALPPPARRLNVAAFPTKEEGGQLTSRLFDLSKRAALTGESLDHLFRRECAHLFREIEGQAIPAPEDQEVQRHARADNQ